MCEGKRSELGHCGMGNKVKARICLIVDGNLKEEVKVVCVGWVGVESSIVSFLLL